MIRTVNGDIKPDELKFCHCHEHIFIAKGKPFEVNPTLCIDDYKLSLEELKCFKKQGGHALVDAQPIGCGRIAQLLLKSSLESKVNIIASTGFHKLIFYSKDHWIYDMSSKALSELIIDEIENGMYINCDEEKPYNQINAKAGLIKIACDKYGITPEYENLFEAAAIASIKTGAPIQCHTELGAFGVDALHFLLNQGVPPKSIIIAHMDRVTDNLDDHKTIAGAGAFLEYDTIGRYKYHSDEDEIKIIKVMLDSGFEENILLGLDTTRARLSSYSSSIGLDYIINIFIPKMKCYGISQDNIDKFMISNPAYALNIAGSY